MALQEGGSDGDKFVKKLDLTSSNVAAQWKIFKSQLEIYKLAKGFSAMTEEVQIANMLLLMGRDCVPIYDQFVFNEEVATKKKTLKNVITMFDKHFEPVKNLIYERVKFNNMKQEANQPLHQFIVAVQTQAGNCDYGDQIVSDLVRDRIVVGVRDHNLRQYLIDIDNLTLETCIQKAKQYETFHEHAKKMESQIHSTESANLDTVAQEMKQPTKEKHKATQEGQKLTKRCDNCGRFFHRRNGCPALKAECFKCHSIGHFSRMCRAKRVNEVYDTEPVEEEMESLFLGSDSL
jgi:hypothetical protein